jgi:hypothetical protein
VSCHRDWRVEIGTAAEPALGRYQETGVHMNCGDMRVRHMRDQADAGAKKAGGSSAAPWIVWAKVGRKCSAHGRDIDADLLEHLALHHPAHPATARAAVQWSVRSQGEIVEASRPIRPRARSPRIRRRCGRAGIQTRFERPVDAGSRGNVMAYSPWQLPRLTQGFMQSAMPAATATFKERNPARIGIRRRRSARLVHFVRYAGAFGAKEQDGLLR